MALLSDIFNSRNDAEKTASNLSERDSLIGEIEKSIPAELLKQADALALAEASNIYKQANMAQVVVEPVRTGTPQERANALVSEVYYANKEASFQELADAWKTGMQQVLEG